MCLDVDLHLVGGRCRGAALPLHVDDALADIYEVSGLCVDVRYMVMGVLANNVYLVSDGEGAKTSEGPTGA